MVRQLGASTRDEAVQGLSITRRDRNKVVVTVRPSATVSSLVYYQVDLSALGDTLTGLGSSTQTRT